MTDEPKNELLRTIELKLTIEEINLILDALGNMPFKEVFQLISNIQNQAASQFQQKQEEQ